MKAADWDKNFGSDDLITLSNEERKYFCLEPLDPTWSVKTFYSKTNFHYKRTKLFFNGNRIFKTIFETKKIISGEEVYKRQRAYRHPGRADRDQGIGGDRREGLISLYSLYLAQKQ